jgi:hypothetical protein
VGASPPRPRLAGLPALARVRAVHGFQPQIRSGGHSAHRTRAPHTRASRPPERLPELERHLRVDAHEWSRLGVQRAGARRPPQRRIPSYACHIQSPEVHPALTQTAVEARGTFPRIRWQPAMQSASVGRAWRRTGTCSSIGVSSRRCAEHPAPRSARRGSARRRGDRSPVAMIERVPADVQAVGDVRCRRAVRVPRLVGEGQVRRGELQRRRQLRRRQRRRGPALRRLIDVPFGCFQEATAFRRSKAAAAPTARTRPFAPRSPVAAGTRRSCCAS